VAVAVEDDVGAVLGDRSGEAVRAEEGQDPGWLALERCARRRVVEERDPHMARRDLLERAAEALHLLGRLGVDAAKRRLAEVGERRVGETPDEALGARDPDRRLPHLDHGRRPIEHADPASAQRLDELVAAVPVPVVVPEHREDRRLDRLHGLDEPRHLPGVAVPREIACEEDQVGFSRRISEDRGEPLVAGPAGMDVTCCGNFDHRRTVPSAPAAGNTRTWRSSTISSRP
jgi:hypothetical protein